MTRVLIALAALAFSASCFALDHNHAAWDVLLKKHVKYVQGGNASRVDYAGFMKDRAQLKAVGEPRPERQRLVPVLGFRHASVLPRAAAIA